MFSYHPRVIERYPTIRAGLVHAVGLSNGPRRVLRNPAQRGSAVNPQLSDQALYRPPNPERLVFQDSPSNDELAAEFRTQQAATRSEIGDGSLSAIPSVAAWRRAFSGFGVKPTQYRNAAEALLRRLTKHGAIPSINQLVDIANLVSIRYRLPVAALDQSRVHGATMVRFADGTERFTDLGSRRVVAPEPGEVIFVDDAGVVSARRWCWRQSKESATGPETVEALFTVEGHHPAAESEVTSAIRDLGYLLGRFQPDAQVEMDLLSPEHPRFESARRSGTVTDHKNMPIQG